MRFRSISRFCCLGSDTTRNLTPVEKFKLKVVGTKDQSSVPSQIPVKV